MPSGVFFLWVGADWAGVPGERGGGVCGFPIRARMGMIRVAGRDAGTSRVGHRQLE